MKLNVLVVFAITMMFVQSALPQAERKISYGVFIDNSGSMRPKLETIKGIAKELVARLEKNDRLTIFRFATDVTSQIPKAKGFAALGCSSDQKQLAAQIAATFTVSGQTAFFDAIKLSVDTLNIGPTSKCGETTENILIFLGDGEDRASLIKRKDLSATLKDLNVKVFAVGFVDDLDGIPSFRGSSEKGKAKDVLKDIATVTNGKAIFPKAKQTAAEIVDELVRVIEDKK
jgi:hypothetical protein